MPSPEKEEEEKPEKRRKRKRTTPPAWRSGLSRFCRRKLCPQGVIFDGQTAQPPGLDGPSETGYLAGVFVFESVVWSAKLCKKI